MDLYMITHLLPSPYPSPLLLPLFPLGQIYVVRPLDHEMNSTHSLVIRALDSSGINPKSTLVRVTISIADVNDCAPVFKEDPVRRGEMASID